MNNFEDQGDDFEIEFFDLLAQETPGISDQPITQDPHLWVRLRSVLSRLVLKGFRLLPMLRTWLLSEVPGNNFADGSSKDEIDMEISDLPRGKFYKVSSSLTTLGSHLFPRVRLWRFVIVGCIVFLVLMLIPGNFSSARDWLYKPFAYPTAAPPNQDSLTGEPAGAAIDENGSNSFPSPQMTVAIWDTGATPGPAPQGQNCVASPVNSSSREVGSSPAWVVGFDGPAATLHVSPISLPVSAFPTASGWAASITLEIQSDYTGAITFSGGSQSDSLPLVFGFGLDPGQAQLFSITLTTQQPLVSPNRIFKARRTAWNITIYVPAAGCYFLKATWPGGHWIINFAAGQ